MKNEYAINSCLYLKQSNWSHFLEILSNNILRSQIFLLWLLLRWKNLILRLRLKNYYDLNIPVKLFVLLFFWKSKKTVEIHNKLEVISHRSKMARKDRDAIIRIQMTVTIPNQCVCWCSHLTLLPVAICMHIRSSYCRKLGIKCIVQT